MTIHSKVPTKLSAIVTTKGCRFSKHRGETGVDCFCNAGSLFVGKDSKEGKFAKTIYHGEHTVCGCVRVPQTIHAVKCPNATWPRR